MVKRVNIDLRKEIHSQAKIVSILKNISLNKYLEDCIEKVLQEDEDLLHKFTSQKKTEKRDNAPKQIIDKNEEAKDEV